ncbi:MAG: methyltransferase domain-containing protein [Rhodothermales bacterium]|nr:methyltransferase domain-containing protein [Rhodothermales bacterium]
MRIEKPVSVSHQILAEYVREGDIAVDATAGRGHDTVFLAGLVGAGGRVHAFDVQAHALQSTRSRIEDSGLKAEVVLHNANHARMMDYVPALDIPRISGIVFNLGYLPGSDKSITTEGETSIEALDSALRMIKAGGIIVVVAYAGHDAGVKEAHRIHEFVRQIPQEQFCAYVYQPLNQINNPPHLVAIRKH